MRPEAQGTEPGVVGVAMLSSLLPAFRGPGRNIEFSQTIDAL
jgi:hypothetical protein